MGMDSLTIYDVKERVPVHREYIWILRDGDLREGEVIYPCNFRKDEYKEDYYYIRDLIQKENRVLKGCFSKYLLREEVVEIYQREKEANQYYET